MGNYNSRLENLFQRWIKLSEENNEKRDVYGNIVFTKDGLMNKPDPTINVEEEWDNSSKRIMFLLKDQPSEWSNDARDWLTDSSKGKDNCNLKSRFMHNIANALYGLVYASPENDLDYETLNFEQVKENFITCPFAFVESKKQGGKSSIEDAVLKKYLSRYEHLLSEEIEILNPNIIVCTNPHLYKYVIDMCGEHSLIKLDDTRHNSIRIDLTNKRIIICSFHPKPRNKSNKEFYDGIMDHYRAFLHSDYYFFK